MTSLAAYYDESVRENVHVVAGYLAPTELWDDFFAPKWRHLLHWATRRSCPLVEYKARDCAKGEGAFEEMEPGDREAITLAAVDIIREACATGNMLGMAAAMIHPGIIKEGVYGDTTVTPRVATKARYAMDKHGYGHCLGWCLWDALKVGVQIVADDTIQPVFDRRDGFHQVMVDNWKAIVGYMGPRAAERVTEPVARDSRLFVALQAADLLAYETKDEAWWRQTDYPVSHALKRLVASGAHQARVLTLRLAHSGLVADIGDTPYLYKPGHHVRSELLWHGQYLDIPKAGGQRFGRDGLPVEEALD